MRDNMVLIRIDELGDECEVKRFTVGDELDGYYMELWKEKYISEYSEQYPECHFYFEDRRKWQSRINQMLYNL